MRWTRFRAGWLALVMLLLSTAAEAQYFGQNKVQYEDFDFKVARTPHFDLYHYPPEEPAVRHAARMAERWYARLSRLLDFEFVRRQPVILYGSHPHFEQTNAIPGFLGTGTGGVTESVKRRVVMPFAVGLGETDHVLGHELVHAFQYAMTEQGARGIPRLPLWFIEGMAEYFSIGPVDAQTAMWIRDAAAREALPTIPELSRARYFPYRWGHAFWAYVGGRWDDAMVGRILRAGGATGDAVTAIEQVVEMDVETLSEDWHAAIRRWVEATDPVARTGSDSEALIGETTDGGSLNVGPALSPDGRRVAFLTDRDLLSVDLVVADAGTGDVIRTLVSTAADPHFDNLQFIESAGAWAPDGRRFAFPAVRRGQPVMTILDVERGRRLRDIPFPRLGEIFNPTWAPDGQRIAFAALRDGLSDLYVYDLESDRLQRLTADPYADLHPAWSPSGASIAFVTDRFTSELERLRFGPYRLALLDVDSGTVRALPAPATGRQINPQWGSDEDTLYFVADPDGINNVYRLALAGGTISPVTATATGVSGITASSPAISVAAGADRMAFSVYRRGAYEIHVVDGVAATTRRAGADATRRAALLPPRQQAGGAVAALLSEPSLGLAAGANAEVADYATDLALDHIGQPQVMAGTDRFGTFLGGGVSFLFSDMLGEHTLGTVVQVGGTNQELLNIAGQLGYVNRASRWTWGGTVERIPFVTGGLRQSVTTVDGQPALVEERLELRQTVQGASGTVAYPFDRARRVEVIGGYRRISYDQTSETQAFSLATGQRLVDDVVDLPAPNAVNYAEIGAALVGDSAVLGPTGPLVGWRYRIEMTPTVGDLDFTSVLADYRHYVQPVQPFTIAARVLHVGRYGGDGSDGRLTPLFLGYPSLVRGYDFQSFTADECAGGGASCRILDDLVGSRMLVANVELRFPLVGAFTGELDYGPLPIDGVVFADAGLAWTAKQGPGERPAFESVGAGVRANLFGAAVLEFDAVRPLDRPEKGWLFVFAFRPGF